MARRIWTSWQDALAEGRAPKAFDWYAVEEAVDAGAQEPIRCGRPATRTARRARVHDVLATAPYQGSVTSRRSRRRFTPGGTGTVTAAFRNVNGLRATGRVDFALTGAGRRAAGARPRSRASPAGGSGTVRWRVTAPGRPLDRPLRRCRTNWRTQYGPRGRRSGCRSRQTGHACTWPGRWIPGGGPSPTTRPSSGSSGTASAIDGAGADLWRGTAEFGAAYREGALTPGRSVTVRVDAQANTGPGPGRASSSATAWRPPAAPGFVNLAVTPANGVVLSYDTNGDGTLDTYQRVTGVKAPVLLRLTRPGVVHRALLDRRRRDLADRRHGDRARGAPPCRTWGCS